MNRVGIIGVGHMGWLHARNIRSFSECELTALYDIDSDRVCRTQQAYGGRIMESLGDVLSACDAVVVAVPTSDHHRVARQCLEAGLHVLVEKPITRTIEEADDLISLAASSNLTLAVGHVERFNPLFRTARNEIRSPLFIEAHRLAPFVPRSVDVDVILDLMIHDLDLILAVHPGEIEHVDASGVPVITGRVDIANARLTFGDGMVANVTASRVSREKLRRIRFFCPRAYASLDLLNRSGEWVGLKKDAADLSPEGEFPPIADLITRRELGPLADANPLADEIADFIGAINGRQRPLADGTDGRRALELALMVRARVAEHVARLSERD